MINKLALLNYQSHKQTELEFSPGVNAIIGSSDAGKTTILRGAYWAITNKPAGDAFRSNWGGETLVAVETDANLVVRAKNGRANTYQLDDTDFNAVGVNVPEEIVRALNLNDINLQQQFDRPFLLDSSPGEVAKHFNSVAHLDIIDDTVSKIQQQIRKLEQSINSDKGNLEIQTAALMKYEHLDEYENAVCELEQLSAQCEKTQSTIGAITGIIDNLEYIKLQAKSLDVIISREQIINFVTELFKQREVMEHAINLFTLHVSEINKIAAEIEKMEKTLSHEATVVLVLELFAEKQMQLVRICEFTTIIQQTSSVYDAYDQADAAISNAQMEFNDKFPNVCPLCGAKKKVN